MFFPGGAACQGRVVPCIDEVTFRSSERCVHRTVVRKSSVGGLYVCAGRLGIIKVDKNANDL